VRRKAAPPRPSAGEIEFPKKGNIMLLLGEVYEDIRDALGEFLSVERIPLNDVTTLDVEVARCLPENLSKRFGCIAVGEADDGVFEWTAPDSSTTEARIRVIARDDVGLASFDDSDADFAIEVNTGIPDDAARAFALRQNVPNPFNPATRIAYSIPERARVELLIYDVAGRIVRRLVDADLPADDYTAVWDGRTDTGEVAASGLYFYRLMADGRELARKMILLR